MTPPIRLAALLALLAAPAVAQTLPAVVDPPSGERHVGKVVFVELLTPDLAASERFYGGLFGWTFKEGDVSGARYAAADLDGRPIAGMLQRSVPSNERRQPWWMSYFAVADVDAAQQAAMQHGAKVLFPPHSFPDRGREAVLADPQGAVFALLASSSGDTPDVLADPGEWIWTSLIARDPDADAAFYQMLFDYDVFELPGGGRHLTLASGGYARATVNPPPSNASDTHSYWLNYVRVDDAEAATAKAVSLGARVLVAPHIDRHGGKVALVADPAGAPVGLMEWADKNGKGAPK